MQGSVLKTPKMCVGISMHFQVKARGQELKWEHFRQMYFVEEVPSLASRMCHGTFGSEVGMHTTQGNKAMRCLWAEPLHWCFIRAGNTLPMMALEIHPYSLIDLPPPLSLDLGPLRLSHPALCRVEITGDTGPCKS